jgi:branched-chain amino acid transport system permease protein
MQEFIIVQVLNSWAYSMLLFVLALGLSLTFGLLRFVNLAHGSFFLIGGYVGSTMLARSGSFALAALAGAAAAALAGFLLERAVLRHFYKRSDLDQVIMSFGCALILGEAITILGGKDIRGITLTGVLGQTVSFASIQYPLYRLLIGIAGLFLFAAVWLIFERTRLGALVRASVDDGTMVGGLGYDVRLLYTGVFALGALLAGLSGIIGAPVIGLYPGLDLEILITTLVVVVVGGLGNIFGAFWAAILIGTCETFGRTLLPQVASMLTFCLMAAVLLVRSIGRFEEEIE